VNLLCARRFGIWPVVILEAGAFHKIFYSHIISVKATRKHPNILSFWMYNFVSLFDFSRLAHLFL